MIRCSHCGKLAPAGATSCQNCGMPLANSGGMASAGQPEQQELPAWLESLRAHERPLAGSGGGGDRQPFSMDELVDENSMPHWMRQNQPRVGEGGSSDAFPALSTAPQPGSTPEQPGLPASGLVAGSLIDEQSLPSWMRGAQESGQNVSAQSLVDQQALPPWIKELGQTGPAQVPPQPLARSVEEQYGLPTQAPVTPHALSSIAPVPQTPPPAQAYHEPPAQGFSAHDLVDQQGLPGWMSGASGPGQQPQGRPVPTESGFAAGELIDQRSLPKWMQDQQGQGKSGPTSAMGMPVNGSGQMMDMGQGRANVEGMPASTLLDAASLPEWMREGEAGGAQAAHQQPGGMGMAAGSLIDKGALPQWMRDTENPQPGASSQNAGPSAGYARNEGRRVPSRPRNDAGAQGQSEAAANIFSSMLGVSASTPVMPGQAPASNLGVAQGQAGSPAQPLSPPPVLPGWQSPQQPAMPNQGAQPPAWQSQPAGPTPQMGAAPAPNMYMPGGQPAGMPGMQPPANRGEQQVYPGYPADRVGAGSAIGVGGHGAAQNTDAKKKGFFDSIRDFFFK